MTSSTKQTRPGRCSYITDCVPTPVSLFSKGQPLKNRVPFLIKNMSTSIEEPENEVQNIELLISVEDLHGEVTVEIKEPMDSELFASMLGTSLSHWRQQGKRGVWIKLPIEFSNLVEPAVKEGFRYHRAELDYLMLVKWIPDVGLLDQVDMVRDHDHQDDQEVKKVLLCIHQDDDHYDDQEVLVVQERNGRFKGTNVWKLPTGTVDEVSWLIQNLLKFYPSGKATSHSSGNRIYSVCMLRPCSFEIQKQDSEIKAAQFSACEIEIKNEEIEEKSRDAPKVRPRLIMLELEKTDDGEELMIMPHGKTVDPSIQSIPFQLVIDIGYKIASSISMMAIERSNCFHTKGDASPCHVNSNPYMISFGSVWKLFSLKLWWLSIVAAVMSFT
ncbi:hypothetical protein Q3G72_031053 [Acer saccharum]|nr:hypothetical protein Q3G72_031053 [Acer saccharum]